MEYTYTQSRDRWEITQGFSHFELVFWGASKKCGAGDANMLAVSRVLQIANFHWKRGLKRLSKKNRACGAAKARVRIYKLYIPPEPRVRATGRMSAVMFTIGVLNLLLVPTLGAEDLVGV